MNTITTLIQAAERMIRDTKTPMGELCATWNRLNFEADTGLSFSTPTRRSKLIERLEAAIIELNSRDDRMNDEAIAIDSVHPEITAHNDLCDLAQAPQHLYAGEELDLTVCFNRKEFERKKAKLAAFIYKEDVQRYFVADYVYKVSPSGFVYRWLNEIREWVDVELSIVNLINMGAVEVTEADINAYTTIGNGRAVYSTDKGRHFVLLDGKHLYEFDNEYNAVEYAQRTNGL